MIKALVFLDADDDDSEDYDIDDDVHNGDLWTFHLGEMKLKGLAA